MCKLFCIAVMVLTVMVSASPIFAMDDNPFSEGKDPLTNVDKTIGELKESVAQSTFDSKTRDKLIEALEKKIELLTYLIANLTKTNGITTSTHSTTENKTQPKDALELISSESTEPATITGIVKNTCDKSVYNAEVTVTLYDKDNRAIEEIHDYHLSDLAPGEEWKFKATCYDSDVLSRSNTFKITGIDYLLRSYGK